MWVGGNSSFGGIQSWWTSEETEADFGVVGWLAGLPFLPWVHAVYPSLLPNSASSPALLLPPHALISAVSHSSQIQNATVRASLQPHQSLFPWLSSGEKARNGDMKTFNLKGYPLLSKTILIPDPVGQRHFQVPPLLTGKKYISWGVKAKFLSSFTIQFYLLTKQV